jgi:flagellar L-ring protein precursor FlgH
MIKKNNPWIFLTFTACVLCQCSSLREKVSELDEGPRLSQIHDPSAMRHHQPVYMPLPSLERQSNSVHPASLWQAGSKAFFKDQRARRVGDIIRVNIKVAEEKQKMTRNKEYDGPQRVLGGTVTNLFGLQRYLGKFMPLTPDQVHGSAPINYMNTSSKNETKGKLKNNSSVSLNFVIAATITQILPNGNLVIMGRQEVGFDKDVRDIVIQGIIRPEDVPSTNTISADRISELRAKYSMRGEGEDLMRTPLAHQLIHKFLPF